jgi:hypothetical protein
MGNCLEFVLFVCFALAIQCHKVHPDYENEGIISETTVAPTKQKQNPQKPQQKTKQNQQKSISEGKKKKSTIKIVKEHIMEHLNGTINKTKEQMTANEEDFYFFKTHDYDNNNMLDGLEIMMAISHQNINETGK